MADACRKAVAEGSDAMTFGDLYLRDIREHRQRQLAGTGLQPVFPLWEPRPGWRGKMIGAGLRARLSCVDSKALDGSFAGREFDSALLESLPATVNPCGENGEFRTFAYDGPMFRSPIRVESGSSH